MAGERILRVTGYLVLDKKDSAAKLPLDDITQDLLDGMVDFNQLDELVVADMPNAVKTKQGIRTDVVE